MISVTLFLSFLFFDSATVVAFLPSSSSSVVKPVTIPSSYASASSKVHLLDPSLMTAMDSGSIATEVTTTVSSVMTMMDSMIGTSSTTATAAVADSFSSLLLSFSDQGQNLAGIFFQASLLPYILFLYFISFRANRINNIGNFGFQFVLLFVLSTIPSGIISKSVYGASLANVDWLHGGAETLLTVANILIVLGFKEASSNPNPPPIGLSRKLALGTFGLFAASMALGPTLGFDVHSPFLFGLGNIPTDMTMNLPWVSHTEPANALSIPTWFIHFSSVFEYLFAMNLVWNFAENTNNEKWKGLTWGMLPLHASGICACTYHFFYNPSSLQYLVTSQAGLTLLGNITLMIAAFRIAQSNGWNIDEINPFPQSNTSPKGLVADGIAAQPLQLSTDGGVVEDSNGVLLAKLATISILASYLVKYGELGLDIPFTPSVPISLLMIVGFPAITAYYYANLSKESSDGNGNNADSIFSSLPSLPTFGQEGNNTLSMDDIKKFGIAGTVAYVLTELAFWMVAFPVAAYALYESTGHWPDVIQDNTDRAAVFAFIFAGANIARAFVPVRLGAALALAPWVDENILNRFGDNTNADVDSNNNNNLQQVVAEKETTIVVKTNNEQQQQDEQQPGTKKSKRGSSFFIQQ